MIGSSKAAVAPQAGSRNTGAKSNDDHVFAPARSDSYEALQSVLNATRALLWIKTPADAAAVARLLVEDLGGGVVAASGASGEALPVDVSFGTDQPALPAAPDLSGSRMLLERHLPTFVRDAQQTVAPSVPDMSTPAFVAVSELSVPEAGREALEAAFIDRLGAVDAARFPRTSGAGRPD